MPNSFEVHIDDLDEDTLWEMLDSFSPEDMVTIYYERDNGELMAGLTDDILWEQAAENLATEMDQVSGNHIARWLDWASEISDTQTSEPDPDEDVDDLLDEDDL